jgi:hypothetical protein
VYLFGGNAIVCSCKKRGKLTQIAVYTAGSQRLQREIHLPVRVRMQMSCWLEAGNEWAILRSYLTSALRPARIHEKFSDDLFFEIRTLKHTQYIKRLASV